jgi:hypothetical protein
MLTRPGAPGRARDSGRNQRKGYEHKKRDTPSAELRLPETGDEGERNKNDRQYGKNHWGMSSLQIVSVHECALKLTEHIR